MRVGPWEGSVTRRRTTTRKPAKTQHGSTTKPKRNEAPASARQASSTLADLQQQVTALTRELVEAREQQTATADVLKVISRSTFDLQAVLDSLIVSAARLTDSSNATIFMRDGDAVMMRAHVGPLAPQLGRRFPINRSWVTGHAMVDARTIHVANLMEADEYPEGKALALQRGHRATMTSPLIRDGVAIGAILVRRTEARDFSQSQIELLESFADQAVIAIENVRLFDDVQARTRELSEAVEQQTATSEVLRVISSSPTDLHSALGEIAESAARLLDVLDVAIMRVEGDVLRLVAKHGPSPIWGVGDARLINRNWVTGRAVVDRTTVHIPDLQASESDFPEGAAYAKQYGHKTTLATPLLREGNPIGAILILRMEVRPFTDKQIDLVTTFADQASIAIENARLFEQVQARSTELTRSVEELRALGEVSQAVNSTLDLETVLATIVANATQLSNTQAGAIYVLDDASREFRLRATYGMDDTIIAEIRDRHIHLGETAVGRAVEQRIPIQVPDIQSDPSAVLDVIVRAGFRALLTVPLLGGDRIVGALVVRRKEPGEFAKNTVELLQTFAAQSVLAIQNARLFHEIEEKGRELAEASQHKSQFLANMSHELRTPLNAILGYTELMADGVYGAPPERMGAVLKRVESNGRHLLGLINAVLDLSKIEAGQLKLDLADYSLANVVQTVHSAVEPLATDKKLTFKTEVAAELPPGHGDERRLTQVLLNLVGNAIKFTDAGEVVIKAGANDGAFAVSVRDTGPGISAADQAKLFQEFQQADNSITRKKAGTGLGLAISKRIVEMHGGKIWLESQVGQGSTFFVTLPVQAQEQIKPN
jgi:signal transduction histidine kinase